MGVKADKGTIVRLGLGLTRCGSLGTAMAAPVRSYAALNKGIHQKPIWPSAFAAADLRFHPDR
jgi:hypothetical protein